MGVEVSVRSPLQWIKCTHIVESGGLAQTEDPHGFKQSKRSECIGITCRQWSLERQADMGLRCKMIYLADVPDATQNLNQPAQVGHVPKMKGHFLSHGTVQRLLSLGRGANKSMYLVSFF